jgi:hypothetical protein
VAVVNIPTVLVSLGALTSVLAVAALLAEESLLASMKPTPRRLRHARTVVVWLAALLISYHLWAMAT